MERITEKGFDFYSGSWPLNPKQKNLIFVHGAAMNATFWQHQVDGLKGSANTVALNLIGHGGSSESKPLGCSSIKEYCEYVTEFINAFDIESPIFCGLSMGGAIVLELLLSSDIKPKGDMKAKGILINTGAKLKVNPMIFETIETQYEAFGELLAASALSPKTDKSLVEPILKKAATCPKQVALQDFHACNRFDVMDRIQAIEAPVLVLTASDDVLSPSKYGAYICEKVKKAIHVHIENAGHFSPVEMPFEVNNAIETFICSE